MNHHYQETAGGRRPIDGIDELRSLVQRSAVTSVILAVPDMQGRLKGKTYTATRFLDHVAEHGAHACAYLFATDIDMNPVNGYTLTSYDNGYGDIALRADTQAMYLMPWAPQTALVYADAEQPGGKPLDVAPRQMLRRQLDQLAGRGITAQVGLETEFVLMLGTYEDALRNGFRGLRPVTTGSKDYALSHPRAVNTYLQDLQLSLARAGRPVEAIKAEGGDGQFEVTFPPLDPLDAADTHLLLKHAASTIAEQHGLTPTFMAAPSTGTGSGCHIHLSLHRGEGPVFAEREGRMPQAMLHVIAGLLDALPHLAPLYAPNINSYKRFTARAFAPVNYTWGRDNRTCALRAVGRNDGLRLEVRLPGADTNPYLALTAVLAAAQHGLDHTLDPPKPTIGNAFQDTDAPRIPSTLDDALTAFLKGGLAADLLTSDVAAHYAHAARHEIDSHRNTVTDVDLRRGFATA
ncbi:glutamine synthetase family protein [Streptomyces sp. NPDC101062]|uniref:glutamine synthetase family protein n=1 Tax=unclassified Streptomyces TaxID=2593676 RepID=UPI0037F21804